MEFIQNVGLNRNLWTKDEDNLILECIKKEKSIKAGLRAASSKLGRSFAASNQRYYKILLGRLKETKQNSTQETVKKESMTFEFTIKSYTIKDGKLIVTI